MLREAQAMAMVSHPNLATIYEVGTFDEHVFLAMEYLSGQTLAKWLRGAHSLEEIVDAFNQAGNALTAVHAAGLVHRDFKPANVMITDDGLVKVLDLGIAKRIDPLPAASDSERPIEDREPDRAGHIDARPRSNSHTQLRSATLAESATDAADDSLVSSALDEVLTEDGAVLGTLAYMAPEQLAGGTAGPAADQFAFAASLYEALTRQRPFAGEGHKQMLANVLSENIQPWPEDSDAPLALRRAIRRALSADPEQRFAKIADLLDACRAALGVRGQLRVMSAAWLAQGRADTGLIPESKLLRDAIELLKEHRANLTESQVELVLASRRAVVRRKFARRSVIGGLSLLALGLAPAAWLIDQSNEELERVTRAKVRGKAAAVAERVEGIFSRAEAQISLIFSQRASWMPAVQKLAEATQRDEANSAGEAAQEAQMTSLLSHLNNFFRPITERDATISSLMVARDDDLELLMFDDPDARQLEPAYDFYNRIVHRPAFGASAFQVRWRNDAPGQPLADWLHLGDSDSRGQPWTGYQPSKRPWFTAAVAASHNQPATEQVSWTRPYLFFITKDAGITGSIAWREGDHDYVLAVDFMLTDISMATTKLEDSDFLAALITRDNHIVGLPEDQRFQSAADVRAFFSEIDAIRRRAKAQGKLADSAAQLPTVADLGIPSLEAALQAMPDDDDVFPFRSDGEQLWAGRRAVGHQEQELTVLVFERSQH